ncbi:MAG TPA: hypothetical protein VGO04_03245 [Ensifer sp.]|uniref:hypothetical protein n=1 Tax=Ensifer sp. TaxID=1872086 RepID=UPI002E126A07|nr:hypothetical protein [Ensifer sp.]
MIIASLVPIGIFKGVGAAARSRDAFGTRGKWYLAFIPIANLLLIFAPSQEQSRPSPRQMPRGILLVALSVVLIAASAGVSQWVKGRLALEGEVAQDNMPLQAKLARYEVQTFGLDAFLTGLAKGVTVPMKIDDITTLTAVEADKDIYRYVYEISDKTAALTGSARDLMMNAWCKSAEITLMTDVGATVEGRYFSPDGNLLGELSVNPALCGEWRLRLDETIRASASAIKGPTKLDNVTTLIGADYRDSTLTYHYTLPAAPSGTAWLEQMKDRLCQAEEFRQMMSVGLNVRGVYTTEANAPIGEVLINSEICSI